MNEAQALKTWFQLEAQRFTGQLFFDEPLSKHTYYRIGGPASVLAMPRSVEDLNWLTEGIRATGVPVFILGSGSNLLVSDAGFEGLVIKTSRLNLEVTHLPNGKLRTGVSVAVSSLLRRASQEGWGGLHFLAGIPGSIGGVVFMNAGTHLGEAIEKLEAVEAYSLLDPELDEMQGFHITSGAGSERIPSVRARRIRYEKPELKAEYRKNLFVPAGALVYAAEWSVTPGDPAAVKAQIDEIHSRRKATQPIDFPSCGSVFKNPRDQGLHAWQVIDQLKLRGHRIGDAQFAEKHCNFIINLDRAKAADVKGLIDLAKSRAKAELGVTLEEEVKYLGNF